MHTRLLPLFLVFLAGPAGAAALRVTFDVRGDVVAVGNTLGRDCGPDATEAPVVGVIQSCPSSRNEDGIDVVWRADAPDAGNALASGLTATSAASSQARLRLPVGARVMYARLYWAATLNGVPNTPDTTVTLAHPLASLAVTADQTWTHPIGGNGYQGSAEVTDFIRAYGSGTYRLSGVTIGNIVGTNTEAYAGWTLFVVYELAGAPLRNVTLFDGFDGVNAGDVVTSTLSGFLFPPTGGKANAWLVAYEGDNSTATGDVVQFRRNVADAGFTQLEDAPGNGANFFNGSRYLEGVPVSVAGDLPQLNGRRGSYSGFDLDNVDVTALLRVNDVSAQLRATTSGDVFVLGPTALSITTFEPDFTSTEKSVVDLNGGFILPGDTLEFRVTTTNTGNDTALDVVLTDVLAPDFTYVPGSLVVIDANGTRTPTDAVDADTADYTPATRTVRALLGTGAGNGNGGTIPVGQGAEVRFRVTLSATATGTLLNQARIAARGQVASGNGVPGSNWTSGAPGFPNRPTLVPVNDPDLDDDGVLNADEPAGDADGDGLPNALDPDSDNDGVNDGTERGVAVAPPGTDVARGNFIPDADPSTRTDAYRPDTDDGGLREGAEDWNHNGRVDPGERDPLNPADDTGTPPLDTDGDGLPDAEERNFGTDPDDADSDDDGLQDGAEANWHLDTDGDGRINALDRDSDGDGLFDGLERGVTTAGPGTDVTVGNFVADLDPTTRTSMLNPDSDGDGLADSVEDANRNGRADANEPDAADADTDDDGLLDGREPSWDRDTDGDGLLNVLDPDSDNDTLFDGTEAGMAAAHPHTDLSRGRFVADADPGTVTNPLNRDTDAGGVNDGAEDLNRNGRVDAGERDPLNPADDAGVLDRDNDGLSDEQERVLGTDPDDADSDDDGLLDGGEPNPAQDTDGDGLINPLDPDSDGDGLFDGTEAGVTQAGPATDLSRGSFIADLDPSTRTSPLRRDTDGGGMSDGAEDLNRNGRVDAGERDPLNPADDGPPVDSDGDGLTDSQEAVLGTNPNDADSDDDGVQDGAEPNYGADSDGDGRINALDPDSDNDGLFDGTESGVTAAGPGTNVSAGVFVPDADPSTRTNPLLRDTDRGGVPDGDEDSDRNGRLDAGERDPLNPADDGTPRLDTDGDGLPDDEERRVGSDPLDADSDDDGVVDGREPSLGEDTDGDGLINVLDPDSDNDGLFDGTEAGVTTPPRGTDVSRGRFFPDADPTTRTNPLRRDTDGGGVSDGSEDFNRNGRVDAGERNPLDAADDVANPPSDRDGDGLSDGLETSLGTDPDDADSDDDGLTDGEEANPGDDADGDGRINPLDPDSDGDGLKDGTEASVVTAGPGTDVSRGNFVPDADPTSRTNPWIRDTDRGGLADGAEDLNGNGRVDRGERNPLDGSDDNVPVDRDGDGRPDGQDNCLEDANPDQGDADGDGLGDVCDVDANGDGFVDQGVGVSGGQLGAGCAQAPGGLGLLLAALGLVRRRRRGGAVSG